MSDFLEKIGEFCERVGDWSLPGDHVIESYEDSVRARLDPEDVEHCVYSIDRARCGEYCDQCGFLSSKPPCQRACKKDAIFKAMGRSYCVVDPTWCNNCGACADACIHAAVMKNGEHVGMTPGKAGHILKNGAKKTGIAILRGMMGV